MPVSGKVPYIGKWKIPVNWYKMEMVNISNTNKWNYHKMVK